MAKKSLAKTLESSNKILFKDDSSFEKNTLISLLEEGWNLKLKDNSKITITEEYLPEDFPSDWTPQDYDFELRKKDISYGKLKEIYENAFNQEYSPEAEEERIKFQMELWEKDAERRSAWGWYAQTMSFNRAIEKEIKNQKEEKEIYDREGQKGVEKLRKKRDDEERSGGRYLMIN